MKVALIAEDVNPRRGGVERSASELALELGRQGVELTVIARRITIRPRDRLFASRLFRVSGRTRSRRWYQFEQAVGEHLAEADYDLVHSLVPILGADVYQSYGGNMRYSANRDAQAYGCPVRRWLKLKTLVFNRARQVRIGRERTICQSNPGPMILASSRYVRQQFQEGYSLSDSRLRVVRSGIDVEPLRAGTAREQGQKLREHFDPKGALAIFLFAASDFRVQGLSLLIQAAAQLKEHSQRNRDFLILVVGGQGYSRYYREVQTLGLGGTVIFLGTTRHIPAMLNMCDAVVLPTYNDACSRLVMESLAAGTPAVTTRYNGAAEFLGDGEYGITLDEPADIAALTDALETVCDPRQQQRYGQAIEADRVCEQVSVRRHVGELISVYRELLQ